MWLIKEIKEKEEEWNIGSPILKKKNILKEKNTEGNQKGQKEKNEQKKIEKVGSLNKTEEIWNSPKAKKNPRTLKTLKGNQKDEVSTQ